MLFYIVLFTLYVCLLQSNVDRKEEQASIVFRHFCLFAYIQIKTHYGPGDASLSATVRSHRPLNRREPNLEGGFSRTMGLFYLGPMSVCQHVTKVGLMVPNRLEDSTVSILFQNTPHWMVKCHWYYRFWSLPSLFSADTFAKCVMQTSPRFVQLFILKTACKLSATKIMCCRRKI